MRCIRHKEELRPIEFLAVCGEIRLDLHGYIERIESGVGTNSEKFLFPVIALGDNSRIK